MIDCFAWFFALKDLIQIQNMNKEIRWSDTPLHNIEQVACASTWAIFLAKR